MLPDLDDPAEATWAQLFDKVVLVHNGRKLIL